MRLEASELFPVPELCSAPRGPPRHKLFTQGTHGGAPKTKKFFVSAQELSFDHSFRADTAARARGPAHRRRRHERPPRVREGATILWSYRNPLLIPLQSFNRLRPRPTCVLPPTGRRRVVPPFVPRPLSLPPATLQRSPRSLPPVLRNPEKRRTPQPLPTATSRWASERLRAPRRRRPTRIHGGVLRGGCDRQVHPRAHPPRSSPCSVPTRSPAR